MKVGRQDTWNKRRDHSNTANPRDNIVKNNDNDTVSCYPLNKKMRGRKREADTDEDRSPQPPKKMRTSYQQQGNSPSFSDKQGENYLFFPVKTSQAQFVTNYIELFQISNNGCGTVVYAGYQTTDDIPVAIKHIPKDKVIYRDMLVKEMSYTVIKEVELMVRAAGRSGGSAVITLIDCFDLEDELILITERSVTFMDLLKYCNVKDGYLKEHEAKVIMRQMVDAAIDMHSKGVFHSDIKLDNILIDIGPDVPRIKIIDFGCGYPVMEGSYYYRGSVKIAPPEWYLYGECQATPTTVWQLGTLLADMLNHPHHFDTQTEANSSLSTECLSFLRMCLVIDHRQRATFEGLKAHPWLM